MPGSAPLRPPACDRHRRVRPVNRSKGHRETRQSYKVQLAPAPQRARGGFHPCGRADEHVVRRQPLPGSPLPSELTVSKRGDKVAWAFDAEGKRNVWIAEGPSWASRQLTRYENDDGQELCDLVFSPNGNAIAYVRGQGKNPAGEYPNPAA